MNPDHSNEPSKLIHAGISRHIVGAFYDVYNELGHGYLESIYARALEMLLRERGLVVDREYPVVIRFRGKRIGFHRCDMLVEKRVIVEIKATELLSQAPKRQLRNYLSGLGLELGMLLHFGPKANYYRILGPRPASRATIDPDESEESG
jgi:GxxExxY protein